MTQQCRHGGSALVSTMHMHHHVTDLFGILQVQLDAEVDAAVLDEHPVVVHQVRGGQQLLDAREE